MSGKTMEQILLEAVRRHRSLFFAGRFRRLRTKQIPQTKGSEAHLYLYLYLYFFRTLSTQKLMQIIMKFFTYYLHSRQLKFFLTIYIMPFPRLKFSEVFLLLWTKWLSLCFWVWFFFFYLHLNAELSGSTLSYMFNFLFQYLTNL